MYSSTVGTSSSTELSIEISNQESFQYYVNILIDSQATNESKLKAAQELSQSIETIQQIPNYQQLLEDAISKFIKVLNETEPQFISESHVQLLRKTLLELMQRIPVNDQRSYTKDVLVLIYNLVEKENEENVLICFRLLIDYYRHFKTQMNIDEVQKFFTFIKNIYLNFPKYLASIFNFKAQIHVKDINDLNLDDILNDTFSSFQILTDKYTKDNQRATYNVIPRGSQSLKVLAECPVNAILMFQLNKTLLNQDIPQLIPLIANLISLEPSDEQRLNENNKEIYADFVLAQVKTLSFLVYFLKSHKDIVQSHADLIVNGIIQLIKNCPPELASVRKELLGVSRHIFISDLRISKINGDFLLILFIDLFIRIFTIY